MLPGPTELILILLIVVMLFGSKKIPEIMDGLGKGIKSFKKAMEGEETTPTIPTQTPAPPPTQAPSQQKSQSEEVAKEKIEPK